MTVTPLALMSFLFVTNENQTKTALCRNFPDRRQFFHPDHPPHTSLYFSLFICIFLGFGFKSMQLKCKLDVRVRKGRQSHRKSFLPHDCRHESLQDAC